MKRSLFFLLLIFTSCIQAFEPEFEGDVADLYVVEGSITNESLPYVMLSKAVGFNEQKDAVNYISGATITLYDDQNNEQQLSEVEEGYYQGTNAGIIGRKYHIEIQLPNGDIITSLPELLKESAEVGDISIEQAEEYVVSPYPDGYTGIIEGLDVHLYMNNNTNAKYYKWTFNSTYKVTEPLAEFPTPCYVTQKIYYYFKLGESVSSEADLISQKLIFLQRDPKFRCGYSLEIIQSALTEEAYNYWTKIDDQLNNVGSVYDTPPAQIVGNLNLSESNDEPVLGYFEVTSVNRKRVYISPLQFEKYPTDPNLISCFPQKPPFDTPPWCTSCLTRNNSTKTIPEFWPKNDILCQ